DQNTALAHCLLVSRRSSDRGTVRGGLGEAWSAADSFRPSISSELAATPLQWVTWIPFSGAFFIIEPGLANLDCSSAGREARLSALPYTAASSSRPGKNRLFPRFALCDLQGVCALRLVGGGKRSRGQPPCR